MTAGRDARVCGEGPLLSNMADWNPAEMIGRRPAPLALSLYRTLITDGTWARQRAEGGYTDLRGVPLLTVVGGAPYVDVAASLTSFLPASLSDEERREIVGAQCGRLRSEPELHDKIEFSVAATCWTPNMAKRVASLRDAAVSDKATQSLCSGLLEVTRAAIERFPRHVAVLSGYRPPGEEDTHQGGFEDALGTAREIALCFAHLARAAFVAVDMLRGLEELGLVKDRESWMRGVSTVSAELGRDAAAVVRGTLTWDSFVARHRWTRPGTYDPTVPSYGQDAEAYLRPLLERPLRIAGTSRGSLSPSLFRPADTEAVDAVLAPVGLGAASAEAFLRQAIRFREAGKALYAAWVSAALESAVAHVRSVGLDRTDLNYLTVQDLANEHRAWPSLVARRRERAQTEATLLELPDVIASLDDLLSFTRGPGRPNFIGTTTCADGPVHLDPTSDNPPPPNAIIVVEAADPGYDWVFSMGISGLVTAYGGANSHMAIRCAELGLPAAIGVGTQQFEACRAATRIRIDAPARRLLIAS